MSLFDALFDPARDAALVTGAGNGIGRAIAQALVGEGVRTVFADVREDRLAKAVAASPRPELAVACVVDLSRPEGCDALLARARETLGRVTHFVHSASPPRHEADHALAVSTETWQQMRAVNVDAGFHLARELARDLVSAGEPGSFLMLTSLHADTPRNLPHYSSSKAALGMLVKELARHAGPPWDTGQRARARRDRCRWLRGRSLAGTPHPARSPGTWRRPGADGAGGAVGPDLGLRDRRCGRGRRRPGPDQLVRSAGARIAARISGAGSPPSALPLGMPGVPLAQGLPVSIHRTLMEIVHAGIAAGAAAVLGFRLRGWLGHRIRVGRCGRAHRWRFSPRCGSTAIRVRPRWLRCAATWRPSQSRAATQRLRFSGRCPAAVLPLPAPSRERAPGANERAPAISRVAETALVRRRGSSLDTRRGRGEQARGSTRAGPRHSPPASNHAQRQRQHRGAAFYADAVRILDAVDAAAEGGPQCESATPAGRMKVSLHDQRFREVAWLSGSRCRPYLPTRTTCRNSRMNVPSCSIGFASIVDTTHRDVVPLPRHDPC